MLYQRWRQIARSCRDRIALCDLGRGGTWTFAELDTLTERRPRDLSPIAFPQGNSAEFVFAVLRAWRGKQVVCPLESGQAEPSAVSGLPKEIVHLKTTSATTGAARLIAFTAEQLIADAENIVATMGLRPEWPNLAAISLAHSYGFSNLVLPLLLHGIPLVLVGSSLPEAVRRAAAIQQSVSLPAVPALWASWHEANAIPENVRLAISAGAPLPLSLEQEVFVKRSLKIHNFYGSSECGGIAYDATPEPRVEAICAGTPLRNVLVAVNGNSCLEVRGPAVGETYWPESEGSLQGGVFRTTDLAEVRDGVVCLLGRATDQINVAGRKVSPEAIEQVLSAHPKVRECVVFGVPSTEAERSESIVGCVALAETATADELRQHVLARLPAWQAPREWWFVDGLESNARGKLSRAQWRRRYLEHISK